MLLLKSVMSWLVLGCLLVVKQASGQAMSST